MNYIIGTQYEPCTICVTITYLRPCLIHIKVLDYFKDNTVLIDRIESSYAGESIIAYLELPLSPKICLVKIYDETDQTTDNGTTGNNFKVLGFKKQGLSTLLKAM